MSQTRIDVLTLGNAIVDVLAHTDEAFLLQKKVHKGAMQLIDEARAEELYGDMGPAVIVSGGSGANTAAGVASFGVKAGFIGKVKNDETGKLFAHDLKAIDVHYDVTLAEDGPATARSFILVTPDGERTMNTYLGACQNLTPDDVNPETVRASSIVYLEGYLWDPPAAKEAFRKAVKIAHEAGNKVALTLSDAFCVDRYRDEFLGLMRDGSLDILFANIHELQSLYGTSDADTALGRVARGKRARRDHPLGRGRADRDPRRDEGRAGLPRRARGRHHRRRRPLRLRLPRRPGEKPRPRRLRPPRRPRRRRDHQPPRRPAAGEPARPGAAGRVVGLMLRDALFPPPCGEGSRVGVEKSERCAS